MLYTNLWRGEQGGDGGPLVLHMFPKAFLLGVQALVDIRPLK